MPAPFPIDPELTAIAIAYRNPALIADEVLPIVPVGKQEFKFWKFDLAQGFTVPDTKVGRRGAPNEIEFNATEQTDSTVDYGLDDKIPQSDIDNAPQNYDPVGHAVEGIMNLVKLGREKRTADIVFNAATYASGYKETLSGSSQFDDPNSTPIKTIADALDKMIMRGNVMVIGQAAWSVLRRHKDIVSAVLGNAGEKGMVSRQAVAELFELDDVLVGRGWLNIAKKGQTPSLSRVWGKHIALLYRDRLANTQRGTTFGYTARFGDAVAGQWEDKNIGLRGGVVVRAGESVKEVIAANDLGYFLENVIS